MRIEPPSAIYIKCTVEATRAGVNLDLSSDPVSWAFLRPGERPNASTIWRAGDWSAGSARYFFDPVALNLDPGTWDVRLKVTDTPEVLAKKVGQIILG